MSCLDVVSPGYINANASTTVYPSPGWHEHDPMSYLTAIDLCVNATLEKYFSRGYLRSSLKCVGITNQRETTITWSRTTGKPLYNAVVWPDTRNLHTVKDLKKKAAETAFHTLAGLTVGEEGIRSITGLPIR